MICNLALCLGKTQLMRRLEEFREKEEKLCVCFVDLVVDLEKAFDNGY